MQDSDTRNIAKALFAMAKTHRHMFTALEIIRHKVAPEDSGLIEALDAAVKAWNDELEAIEKVIN